MKIDIIIPTYNRADYLNRSIQSVLNQTNQDFDLIIVDDGSTDHTSKILEPYKSHSKIQIISQENRGVSAARNTGAKSGKNEWLAFLDSDDEWLNDKLENQINFLVKNPELHFLHSEEIWIRNNSRVNPKVKHSKSSNQLIERSLEFCLISPSTVVIKKELFNKFGGFDESLVVCEDFDLWNKILLSEKIGFIETPLINKYGGHSDQLSTTTKAMDYWRIKSLFNLYQRHTNLINEEFKFLILNIIESKSRLLLSNYKKYNNHIQYNEILELLKVLKIKHEE
jgi:glycosyltransferase involved in cell wall biosynthesis